VNYDNDEDWSQWTVAAKLRILTQPNAEPPMERCIVEHKNSGSKQTPVSSMEVSRSKTPPTVPAARVSHDSIEQSGTLPLSCVNDFVIADSDQTLPMNTMVGTDAGIETSDNDFDAGASEPLANWEEVPTWAQTQPEDKTDQEKIRDKKVRITGNHPCRCDS